MINGNAVATLALTNDSIVTINNEQVKWGSLDATARELYLYGCNSVQIDSFVLDAAQVQKLNVALDWKYRGKKFRPNTEHFLKTILTDAISAAAKYAENQAYMAAEKEIFEISKNRKVSPDVIAKEYGIQLRDK